MKQRHCVFVLSFRKIKKKYCSLNTLTGKRATVLSLPLTEECHEVMVGFLKQDSPKQLTADTITIIIYFMICSFKLQQYLSK